MAYAPARRALFPSRLTWEKQTIDATVYTNQKRTSCEIFKANTSCSQPFSISFSRPSALNILNQQIETETSSWMQRGCDLCLRPDLRGLRGPWEISNLCNVVNVAVRKTTTVNLISSIFWHQDQHV